MKPKKPSQKKRPAFFPDLSTHATRLNGRVIMTLAGVLAVVILLIILMSFSGDNRQPATDDNGAINTARTVTTKDKGALNKLPAGYQDAAAIDRLLHRNQKPAQPTYQIPASVQQELSSLRSQQAALQSQLALLKQQGQQQPVQQPVQQPKTLSPLDREAMTSAIFFSCGAPRPIQKNANNSNTQNSKKSTIAAGKSSGKQDKYASQNMQAEKLDFMTSKPSKDIYNKNTIQYPVSKYILQAGSVIPAILETQIVSSLPGTITALVTQNVYDSITGNYLLIPKGSKLIGEYNSKISYGQDQLQAKFTRLIRPNGTSIVLPSKSSGVNPMGVSGFEDEVDNHWWKIIGSAALATMFNIPAVVATSQSSSYGTIDPRTGQYLPVNAGTQASNAAWQSIGQTASQVGSQLTQRSLNIQPTILIHAGYEFSVMVTKDIVLPPYHSKFYHIPETGQ